MLVLFGSGGAFADTYELYSGAITEGDYLLVYANCAMNTTVSNSRLQFQAVQIVDNKITSGTADFSTIVWTITKSGDYYALYNASAGKYAASTGTKNQAGLLDSGTDDKSLWTITGSWTYEFVNKYNDAHNINKNLRKNGTYGFACYATSTGGSLLLYKKVTSVSPLSSIAVEGYKSTFHKGDSFEFGGTVTATYEDGTTNDVTNRATFTGYDMNTVGEQTVTVSYTEGKITMTVTYKITVTAPGEENPNNSFAVEEDNATIGEPYTMPEFTTSSDGAKSYSSSDTDVATINNNGEITLLKAGTTTITARTAQTATYAAGEASFILTVKKGTPTLSFNVAEFKVEKGSEKMGPDLTKNGGGDITYSIDNTAIAIIEKTGYIKALEVGEATVTATSKETDAYKSATATYKLIVTPVFEVNATGTYELVTDIKDLAEGTQVIIANSNYSCVMGIFDNDHFNVENNIITFKESNTIVEVEEGSTTTAAILEGNSDDGWYFHVNGGYLYACSSSKNQIKTRKGKDDSNAKALISFNGNDAVVKFQGNNTRNVIKYNSASPRFSCYESGQNPIQLYRKIRLPKVPISFAESVVEITYGDNYNKQKATAEGFSGDLVYSSSNERVVKFHGNGVIDVLGPGTVTITATAPATEATSESSATYTLKIHEPADAVEGQTELLNEKFDDCKGDEPKDGFGGNSSGFTTVPTSLTEAGWELSHCQAGAGFLKLTSGDGNGIVVTPTLDLNGQSEFSFEIAPWVNETATIEVSLENATFEDGVTTSKTFNDLEQNTWKTKTFDIIGNGNVKISITSKNWRSFIDNFVVGGGAQPAHEINLTFSSAGYLTWVATADIDFEATEGVTAYQITEATPQGITAEEVKKAPKGAALLLKGTGTVELKRTSGVASLNGNKMQACTDASVTGITGSATSTDIYVLGNGGNGLGFYMLKNTLQAGKGYLKISGDAGAKATFIGFEETEAAETTGISDYTVPSTEDDNFYNLQGVRVVRPQKGIYIKNGKKMIIK